MGRLTDDILKFTVVVDSNPAQLELGELQQKTRELESVNKELRKEMRLLEHQGKKNGDEWNKLNDELNSNNKQIDQNKARMQQLTDEIGLNGLTLKQLQSEAKKTKNSLINLIPGTKEWNEAAQKLNDINARIRELHPNVERSNKMFGLFKQALPIASAASLLAALKKLGDEFVNLDEKMADVRKTTGLTDNQVKELASSLKSIDTRTSRDELLDLARIAGKLGISLESDIRGFVRSADKINVALSEDLGGNVEEAIGEIGKIVDLFKVKEEYGLEDGLLKVGSAINSLGASSTANEAYIVEFTKRMGGIAPNANISVSDILGLAATLDSLGQTAEVSTTVLGQLLGKMGSDVPRFAEIAGMGIQEFSDILSKDANEALMLVLKGAQSNTVGLQGLASTLETLDVDGQRAIGIIGTLSNNLDTLQAQQELANKEFTSGTSILKEFAVKNETTGASIEKIGNAIKNSIVSAGLTSALNAVAKSIADILTPDQNNLLVKEMENSRVKVNVLALEMNDLNVKLKQNRQLHEDLRRAEPASLSQEQTLKLNDLNFSLDRKKGLYKELKELAPEVVKGISEENTETERLIKNIGEYNSKEIERIALKRVELEMQDALTRKGEAYAQQIEAESELYTQLIELKDKVADKDKNASNEILSILNSEIPLYDKAVKIKKVYKSLDGGPGTFDFDYNNLISGMTKLNQALAEVTSSSDALNQATANFKVQKEQLNELLNGKNENEFALKVTAKFDWSIVSGDIKNQFNEILSSAENGLVSTEEFLKKEEILWNKYKNSQIKAFDWKLVPEEFKSAHEKLIKERESGLISMEMFSKEEAAIKQKYLDMMELAQKNAGKREVDLILENSREIVKTYDGLITGDLTQVYQNHFKAITELHKEGLLSEEEYANQVLLIQSNAALGIWEINEDLYKKNTELYSNELEFWKWNLDQKLISEQEFNEKVLETKKKYQEKFDKIDSSKTIKADKKNPGTPEVKVDFETKQFMESIEGRKILLNSLFEDGEIGFQEYAQRMLQIYQEVWEKTPTDFAKKIKDIKNLYKEGLITEEEYKKRLLNAYIEASVAYLDVASNAINAYQNFLQASMNKELAAVGNNEQKKDEIRRKYAKKQQFAAIGQAVINGAVATLKIAAEIPPPFSYVLMAAQAIMTASEVALIKSQEFFKGGFTPFGNKYQGYNAILHGNEFVANNEATANKTVLPVLEVIDQAQKDGSISQLNLKEKLQSEFEKNDEQNRDVVDIRIEKITEKASSTEQINQLTEKEKLEKVSRESLVEKNTDRRDTQNLEVIDIRIQKIMERDSSSANITQQTEKELIERNSRESLVEKSNESSSIINLMMNQSQRPISEENKQAINTLQNKIADNRQVTYIVSNYMQPEIQPALNVVDLSYRMPEMDVDRIKRAMDINHNVNVNNILEYQMRIREAGITGNQPNPQSNQNASLENAIAELSTLMRSGINANLGAVDNEEFVKTFQNLNNILKSGIKTKFVYRDFKDYEKEISDIESSVSM